MKTGPLEQAILRMKAGNYGWGHVFGRVILGYLYERPGITEDLDAIIPTPAFVPAGQDRRAVDHAWFVIKCAAEQDTEQLPFMYNPPMLIRTRPPKMKMRFTSGWLQRQEVAEDIYKSLHVPNGKLIRGRDIMVYDDVFTGGNTLNAVARRLKEAGARSVVGLSLARTERKL